MKNRGSVASRVYVRVWDSARPTLPPKSERFLLQLHEIHFELARDDFSYEGPRE